MKKHLSLEGIEINGSLTDFINKLVAKGYVIVSEPEPLGENTVIAEMKGHYGGYPGLCNLLIFSDSKENVYEVTISGKERYLVEDALQDFTFFTEKAEKYDVHLDSEANDRFTIENINSLRDFTLNKFKYYVNERNNTEIFVTLGAGINDSLDVSMSLSNKITFIDNKDGESSNNSKDHTYIIVKQRKENYNFSKNIDNKFELKISAIFSALIAFIISLFLMLFGGGIVDFLFFFTIIFLGVMFIAYLFRISLDKGYDMFYTKNDYRGSSSAPRVPKIRIRKYSPTSWKTKNSDKLFY